MANWRLTKLPAVENRLHSVQLPEVTDPDGRCWCWGNALTATAIRSTKYNGAVGPVLYVTMCLSVCLSARRLGRSYAKTGVLAKHYDFKTSSINYHV